MKKELSFKHRLICALPYSLIHFLISHECFELFIRNACNESIRGNDMFFLTKLESKELSPTNIIKYAFVWIDTREGGTFWYRRSTWYKQYLQNLKK